MATKLGNYILDYREGISYYRSMKSTKIWNSGLEYILSAAFEAGIGIQNIELRLSASGVTGEGEAHRLMANLAKCGAKVTQNGDVLTVSVNNEQASECLRRDSGN